jgi:hypothetical protein
MKSTERHFFRIQNVASCYRFSCYIRFHPVYRPCFYFTRKQMTPLYSQQSCQIIESILKYKNGFKSNLMYNNRMFENDHFQNCVYFRCFFLLLKPQCTAKWHVFYIRNRHISVSSFVYKYDQWPHDS